MYIWDDIILPIIQYSIVMAIILGVLFLVGEQIAKIIFIVATIGILFWLEKDALDKHFR